MRYAVDLTEHNLKIVYRHGRDHHLPDLMSRMSVLTPGSVEAMAVGDAAMGMTAGTVEGTDCSLGSRCLGRKDLDLFCSGSAQRRLQVAVAAIDCHEGKSIAALLREAQDMVGPDENLHSGDEHESHIMDFYDMMAMVQSIDMEIIRESQQTDRFASQMLSYLLKDELPTNERELHLFKLLRLIVVNHTTPCEMP